MMGLAEAQEEELAGEYCAQAEEQHLLSSPRQVQRVLPQVGLVSPEFWHVLPQKLHSFHQPHLELPR